MCGERKNWKLVDTSKKGFSVGKAAVGGILLGGIGLLGGALGNVSFKPFYTINPFRLLACVGDLFSSDAFFGKHSREHTLVEPRNQRLHRCPIVCLRTG